MSIASVAAQQSSAQSLASTVGASAVGANTTTGSAGNGPSSVTNTGTTSTDPFASLSSNFQDFLQMLTTQLQNQDPTAPMDTNEFTTELVQFSEVEQQINTNNSLQTLIQTTQGDQLLQGASLTGKQVTLNSNQLPLQNGNASLSFTVPAAGQAAITVTNSAGAVVDQESVNANAGVNTWSWDGSMTNGGTAPDGPYTVSITSMGSNGQTQVPFTVNGTVTGTVLNSGTVDLQLGAESVPLIDLGSVNNGS